MYSFAAENVKIDRRPASGRLAVRLWLFGLAGLILAMILLGGATRLTGSGLSITEWQPIMGAVPPLSDAAWQEAFAKYQQIPQYRLINRGMSLAEFKVIYWWEWAHRFLGRFIGLAFLAPFLVFWRRGAISRALMPKLLLMFALGGLQGVLGWYMVKSGLAGRVDVSQYRLAAHLGLAVFIFGYIFWIALGLDAPAKAAGRPLASTLSAAGLAALVYAQIILGAFAAGTKAGLSHNTWPLIGGKLIPDGLWAMTPWYRNLFENVLTVQFNHRMAAYAVAVWALLHAYFAWRTAPMDERRQAFLLALAVLAQIALGIWTLLAHGPAALGLAHQAGAIIVFALAIFHLRQLWPAAANVKPPRAPAPNPQ